MSKATGFRKDINGLRAIAVASVVFFHFGVPFVSSGFVGVDIFFVISGYLMTKIIIGRLETKQFKIIGFYLDRAIRIIPALLVLVSALCIFGIVLVDPFALKVLAKHSLASVTFLSNIIYWTESGYFDVSSQAKWLLHTWSLSAEWQFYLLYPIALVFIFAVFKSKQAIFWLIVGTVTLSFALSVAASATKSENITSFGYFMLPTRAWELLAGGMVLMLEDKTTHVVIGRLIQYLGIALIVLSCFVFSKTTPWPGWAAIVPVAGTALVIWTAKENIFLSMPPIQYLGRVSYSLYLWHWPILVAFSYFGWDGDPLAIALGMTLALAAAHLSSKFVEGPSQSYLKRRPSLVPFLGAIGVPTLVIAAVCVAVMSLGGLPQRVRGDRKVYADAVAATSDRTYPESRCGGLSKGQLRPCQIGHSVAGKDVLVVGDSFAEQWWPRAKFIEGQLTNHALVFATYQGCPVLPGIERAEPGYSCRIFYRQSMKLARSGRFSTVIFVGQWAGYFREGRPEVLVPDAQGKFEPVSGKRIPALISRFARDLSSVTASGARVIVLKTTPFPGVDLPTELRKASFYGQVVPKDRTLDWTASVMGGLLIDLALGSISGPNIAVVDPASTMCSNNICPVIRDKKSLYADRVHLRAGYAQSAGTFLDPYFLGRASPKSFLSH